MALQSSFLNEHLTFPAVGALATFIAPIEDIVLRIALGVLSGVITWLVTVLIKKLFNAK